MQNEKNIVPTLGGLDNATKVLSRDERFRAYRVFNNLIRQDYY